MEEVSPVKIVDALIWSLPPFVFGVIKLVTRFLKAVIAASLTADEVGSDL